MKKFVKVETEETNCSPETESLLENTPGRMWNHKIETVSNVSVTSEEVARHIKAATDPYTQQLAHLYELMQELKVEQPHSRNEETASSGAAKTSADSTSWSDTLHQW